MIIDYSSINRTRCFFFNVPEGFHQLLNILSLAGCRTIVSFRDKYQSGEFQHKTSNKPMAIYYFAPFLGPPAILVLFEAPIQAKHLIRLGIFVIDREGKKRSNKEK